MVVLENVVSPIFASTDGDYPSGATYGGPLKTLMTGMYNWLGGTLEKVGLELLR